VRHIAVAVLSAAVLAGCTKVGSQNLGAGGGRHPWTQPGVLRIGAQTEANTLNPLLSGNTTEAMIDRLMFDPLVSVDASGKREVPVLAAVVPTLENGGISSDGLTITYQLRHDVLWHDGVVFTSRDVAFTWRAIMNPNNNLGSRTGYELVRSVDTPDPYTVVFHMKQRFSPAVNTIFGESDSPYAILPEHLLGRYPNINSVAFNSSPVGTGPFKFKEWLRGDHLTLVPNDRYFLGAPALRKIVIRPISDENTELSQLRTHEIDWQFEASQDEYNVLRTLTDVKTILTDHFEFERIEINTKHPPLDDVRVRRAILYAIDRRKLVDSLTYGSAQVADEDLPPFMWAHSDDVTRYPYDLAKARQLMAVAGWLPARDGMLHKNGRRLTLELTTNNSNATRRLAVVQVQAMLHELGIEVGIKEYLGSLLYATMGQGGILQNGRFDLAWTGWIAGVDPDQSSLYMCSAWPPNGNNDPRYCNPALDAAEEEALTHFDTPTRKAAYAKIEAILTRDVPMPAIWWPRLLQPINPDFKNFAPNPVVESWNAYQWAI